MTVTFAVGRKDLRQSRWIETPPAVLGDGAVRMRIDSFALTANNITYGAFGDTMSYWSFFPTGDDHTGCIPVWGFATVAESRCPDVAVGGRFYGYWPMADETVLQPVRVDGLGFIDGAAHRRELPLVYNHYLRCDADPAYRADQDGLIALLRPLFTTSFLIDDFLADNGFFGARRVLVSSASSKTSWGLAHCLSLRRGDGSATSVGLTSAAHVDYVDGLGCWDAVLPYDRVQDLDPGETVVYVDMSGDTGLRAAIHGHWGDRLAYSCSVGGTHWESLGGGKGLAGPRPVLFFAPAQAKKRSAEWGAAGLRDRLAAAWAGFIEQVARPDHPWLTVVAGTGRAAVETTYRDLLEGRVPANEGRILSV